MRLIALAAIRAGIIDASVVSQMKRWGTIPRELDTSVVADTDAALEGIQYALEAEEQVRLQSTDLDILKEWLNVSNQRKGQLVIVDTVTGAKATKTVTFATRSRLQDVQYVIPWVSDSVVDTLTNGKTYLRYTSGDNNVKVFFSEIAELFFGEVKAFMLCTGIVEESNANA